MHVSICLAILLYLFESLSVCMSVYSAIRLSVYIVYISKAVRFAISVPGAAGGMQAQTHRREKRKTESHFPCCRGTAMVPVVTYGYILYWCVEFFMFSSLLPCFIYIYLFLTSWSWRTIGCAV